MTILSDILSKNALYVPENTDIEYHKSHMSILMQQLKRRTNIEQSKIWDYVAVENDPWFSRRYPSNSNKLNNIMNKLTLSQQALTGTLAQLHLAKVYNFIPKNFLDIIKTYTRLVDSFHYSLPTINQNIPFRMIEQALVYDLLSYFDNGSTTYTDIVDMAISISQNLELFDNIKTGNLKSVLSLPLSKFLPNQFSSILDSLSYIDLLDQIFTDDTDKNNFNVAVVNILDSYQDSTTGDYVDSSYEQFTIGYGDPLGTITQESLMSDLSSNLFTQINKDLLVVYNQYNISPSNQTQITNTLIQSFQDNITEDILDSNILLPSLTDCTNIITSKSNNDIVTAVKTSFVLFQTEILKRIPEIVQTSDSFDYLINIKTNLEKRDKYLRSGVSKDRMYDIQSYINSVTVQNLSDKEIDMLYIKIKEVLKL